MHLRAGAPVLWREEGVCQVGSAPGRAVVVSGLDRDEQRLLEHLSGSPDPIDLSATALRLGLSRRRAERLAQMLLASGVLAPDQVPCPVGADEVYWDALVDDARARSRRLARSVVGVLGAEPVPRQTMAARAGRRHPQVCADHTDPAPAPDPLALPLACHLAVAGVGTVLLHGDKTGGEVLRSRHPALVQHAPLGTRPDLTVTISTGATDLVQERRLQQEDLSHLLVTVRETGVEVGPLVVPGSTPCGMCVEMWRRDADPAWPALTLQLRAVPRPALESLLAEQCAALAARMVLDALACRGRAWWGTSVELTAVDPLGAERRWEPHPDCGCGAG